MAFGLDPKGFATPAKPKRHNNQRTRRKSPYMRPIGDTAARCRAGQASKDLHAKPAAQNDPRRQGEGFEEHDEDKDDIDPRLWVKEQVATQNPCNSP